MNGVMPAQVAEFRDRVIGIVSQLSSQPIKRVEREAVASGVPWPVFRKTLQELVSQKVVVIRRVDRGDLRVFS